MQSGSSTALSSTTVLGFCYFRFFAEVGTEVSLLPWLGFLPRGSTAWGGSTVRAEVPPPAPVRLFMVLCWGCGSTVGRYGSTAQPCGSTAWLQAVVPRVLAVVPLARHGSTAGRGLVGG